MEKNITGEKMLSHIDRIVGEKKPITADMFLTNYCNTDVPIAPTDGGSWIQGRRQ
mgnify:CR=1 FL=1